MSRKCKGRDLTRAMYHGGAKRGKLVTAEADIRQAVADSQAMLNDISLEVTVAHRAVVSAQARVELAQPAALQSAEALRIVRERYRGGTATPTDVIDAETTLTRAEQRYASARIEYLSALARLAYVMGDDAADLCLPLTEPAQVREASANSRESAGVTTPNSFRRPMSIAMRHSDAPQVVD